MTKSDKLKKLLRTIRVCINRDRDIAKCSLFKFVREDAEQRASQLEYILSEIGEKPTE